jgi:hypothetical protein
MAHDGERLIWLINVGAQTAESAMQNIGLNPIVIGKSDEAELWRDYEDAPNLQTLLQRKERDRLRGEQPPSAEWIMIQRHAGEPTTHIEQLLHHAKRTNTRAIIVAWTNSKIAGADVTRVQTAAKQAKWGTYVRQIQNTKAGGHIEANTTFMIIASDGIIQHLEACRQTDDDDPSPMEDILEVNDGIFRDCNKYQSAMSDELKQQGTRYYAQIKGRININPQGAKDGNRNVYDITYPLPTLQHRTEIMIEATNGVTHQKTRPLRRRELFRAIGVPATDIMGEEHTWQRVYQRLRHTTPRQTWERILATLWATELATQEEHPFEEAAQQSGITRGNNDGAEEATTMVARVINRWTTLPEPTKEQWQDTTETDHDLKRIKTALETNQPLEKAPLHDKKYFDDWTKGKLELEDSVIYQYEEPKATQIRQLRRRVVPKRLRNVIITAYHATPLAGHTGVFKTYWRIAARYY